jgi:hypothetical protein
MEAWKRLDSASPEEARQLLTTCCGSSAWVERMLRKRPFGSTDALLTAAPQAWLDLTHTDWLEAFSHHPKIGDRASLARRFAATAHLSSHEQRGVADSRLPIAAMKRSSAISSSCAPRAGAQRKCWRCYKDVCTTMRRQKFELRLKSRRRSRA